MRAPSTVPTGFARAGLRSGTPQRFTFVARRRYAVAFGAAWLAVQVAVPAIQLTGPRPARFGWQMFSTVTPLHLVVGVRRGESAGGGATPPAPVVRDTLPIGAFVAALRAEIDHRASDRLATHICARRPAYAAIEEYDLESGIPRLVRATPCR